MGQGAVFCGPSVGQEATGADPIGLARGKIDQYVSGWCRGPAAARSSARKRDDNRSLPLPYRAVGRRRVIAIQLQSIFEDASEASIVRGARRSLQATEEAEEIELPILLVGRAE